MKLSNVCDEDLKKVAKLKNKKGNCRSEANIASQILITRNKTHGFGNGVKYAVGSHLDSNIERKYISFEEANGHTLEEYLELEKTHNKSRYDCYKNNKNCNSNKNKINKRY